MDKVKHSSSLFPFQRWDDCVKQKDRTALEYAIANNHQQVVEFLLDFGVDINQMDKVSSSLPTTLRWEEEYRNNICICSRNVLHLSKQSIKDI